MNKIKLCKDFKWLYQRGFIREHSSKEWLLRQKSDPYVERAKLNNYRYF